MLVGYAGGLADVLVEVVEFPSSPLSWLDGFPLAFADGDLAAVFPVEHVALLLLVTDGLFAEQGGEYGYAVDVFGGFPFTELGEGGEYVWLVEYEVAHLAGLYLTRPADEVWVCGDLPRRGFPCRRGTPLWCAG